MSLLIILWIIAMILWLLGLPVLIPYFYMYKGDDYTRRTASKHEYENALRKHNQVNVSNFYWLASTLGAGLICWLLIAHKPKWMPHMIAGLIVIVLFVFYVVIFPFPLVTLANMAIMAFADNGPFLTPDQMRLAFPDSALLETHWDKIRWEYENFVQARVPSCLHKNLPGFFLDEGGDKCWRNVFLKRMGKLEPEMTKYFPITQTLLTNPRIHNAMFSILDPHVDIPGHWGYFKGYLRYHLGIIVSKQPTSPYIVVGGYPYTWKEGQGVMFDDMYYHYVRNGADGPRVVLYLDVLRNGLPRSVQRICLNTATYIEKNPFLRRAIRNQHAPRRSSTSPDTEE